MTDVTVTRIGKTGVARSRSPAVNRYSELLRPLPLSMAPAIFALFLGLGGSAIAGLAAVPNEPAFTSSDLETINRNETLKTAVGKSPWLVYRVLRTIDARPPGKRAAPLQEPNPPSRDFDPRRDPDLGEFQRVAPEAAHDLFVLIKKAGGGKSK